MPRIDPEEQGWKGLHKSHISPIVVGDSSKTSLIYKNLCCSFKNLFDSPQVYLITLVPV